MSNKYRMSIITIATLFSISLYSNAFADEIQIPFAVKIDAFKKECLRNGIDFYGNDESMGFIENKGGRIIIYTYKSFDKKKLEIVQKSAMRNLRN